MKKMMILVGLFVLSVLVIGCTQGTLAGEATKLTGTRAGELQRVCPSGCDLDKKITALDLECQSFGSDMGDLNGDLGYQTFDSVCERNGYQECVGVTYWGTYGSEPFTPEEKIALTFSMPGSCELSYQEEKNSIASYFGNEVTWQDFGININVDCCRIR